MAEACTWREKDLFAVDLAGVSQPEGHRVRILDGVLLPGTANLQGWMGSVVDSSLE